MKSKIFVLAIIFSVLTINAQIPKYSVGIIGTHFHNDSYSNRITESENPFGYGIILTNRLTKDFSIGVTGEYLKGDLKNNYGNEKNVRFQFFGIVHPITTKYLQPYISGGFVYTHRMLDYSSNLKTDQNDDLINGRLSLGVNVPIISNLFINGDLGMYTDGYGYVGWGSNLGFRIGL